MAVLLGGSALAVPGLGATVTFDALVPGTVYGLGTHAPGDLIFSEDLIDVRLQNFTWGSGGSTFKFGMSAAPGVSVPGMGSFNFGTGNLFATNNINLQFDFSHVGFQVDHVTVQYANNGGNENIAVNGATLYRQSIASAPADIAPGVTKTVLQEGNIRTLQLSGPVTSLLIGGQEFGFDNVVATPEPSALWLLSLGAIIGWARKRK